MSKHTPRIWTFINSTHGTATRETSLRARELVSAPVAATLIRKGYRAKALQGGLADWITAKFPTDEKDAPKQAPPKAGGLKG